MPIITLTTDFGTADTWVAQMKGVILAIAPAATIVDVTHALSPGDVPAAAFALASAVDAFPAGTIHVAVVDPGVGSARRGLAAENGEGYWVGPDNGVFSAVLAARPARRVVSLDDADWHRRPVSPTFHGRDVFAPVAARLATGTAIERLGAPLTDPLMLALPAPIERADRLECPVIWVDRFGNLVTCLRRSTFEAWAGRHAGRTPTVRVGGQWSIGGLRRTFADVEPGTPLAYFGSGDRLEVAVRDGSAADALRARVGTPVVITTGSDGGRSTSTRPEGHCPRARPPAIRSQGGPAGH